MMMIPPELLEVRVYDESTRQPCQVYRRAHRQYVVFVPEEEAPRRRLQFVLLFDKPVYDGVVRSSLIRKVYSA